MSMAPTVLLDSSPISGSTPRLFEARLERLETMLEAQQRAGLAIVVSSGGLDHVMSALVLATTARAMGEEAHVFFSFWAIPALRRSNGERSKRGWPDRFLSALFPRGIGKMALSRMNLGGAGTVMMRQRMRQKGIPSCTELLEMAAECGVRLSACEMTLDLMGLTREDLIDYPDLSLCGAGTFLATAQKSATTLFI